MSIPRHKGVGADADADLAMKDPVKSDAIAPLRHAAVALGITGAIFAVMLFASRIIGPSNFASRAGAASTVERKIGEFKEGNEAAPGVVVVVGMTVYADIDIESDPELGRIVESHQGQIRSAVSETLRGAPYSDLVEPTLTTLKRKMKVAMIQATGEETHVFDQLLIPAYDVRKVN